MLALRALDEKSAMGASSKTVLRRSRMAERRSDRGVAAVLPERRRRHGDVVRGLRVAVVVAARGQRS